MNKMFKISSVAAALVLGGLLTGCGSSSNDGGSIDVNKTAEVKVVDSLVTGAKVRVIGSVAGKEGGDTNSSGIATITYDGNISSPVFYADEGGDTAGGLKSPKMYSNVINDGKVVINPYTTLKVAQPAAFDKLPLSAAQKEDALKDYSATKDTEFAKATVALASMLRCTPIDAENVVSRGADNATQIAGTIDSAATNADGNLSKFVAELKTATNTINAITAIDGLPNDVNKTVQDIEVALTPANAACDN